jgi:hypothetical protein
MQVCVDHVHTMHTRGVPLFVGYVVMINCGVGVVMWQRVSELSDRGRFPHYIGQLSQPRAGWEAIQVSLAFGPLPLPFHL